MKTKNFLKMAFLLLALVGGVNSVWADTELKNVDFTDKTTWPNSTVFSQGNTTTADVINDITFYSKSSEAEKQFSLVDGGLTFPEANMTNSNYLFGLPITEINGSITITLKHAYSTKNATFNYFFVPDATEFSTSTGVSPVQVTDANKSDTEISVTVETDKTKGYLYIGRKSSSYKTLKGFTVTTPAAATAPIITTQPASATYAVDATPAALTVEATASAGDLSYQWYKNTDQDKTAKEGDKIAGATSATLDKANISTALKGTTYYYVVVEDGKGSTTSDLATIEVVTGVKPEVSATISAGTVRAGTTVTLTATIDAGVPAPTLQWYTCDVDGTNEAAIDGATNTTYQPSTASTGTFYFKVKAHNDNGDDYSDVLKLTVIAQGVSGDAGDLVTISSNYTFIADNHTSNGAVGFASGYLYDESRIYSPSGNSVATNKGKSTIDGVEYFNSLRVKSNSQDILAFKVGGTCAISFYAETTGKTRPIKVGNAVNDDRYGNITDANEEHIVYIPSATTVYLTGTGDRFIAGFKVTFTVSGTITPAGWSTFASSYPLDLSTISGGAAYYASAASGSTVTLSTTTATVPAGEGIMVKGTAGETFTINVAASGTEIDGNLLKGQTTTGNVAASTSGTYHYVFGYKKPAEVVTEYGFYNLADDTEIAAGKAYLETTTELSGARIAMIFDDEDATGINNVKREAISNNRFYNLNGQEIAQPTKGLYIVNGKKVVIK